MKIAIQGELGSFHHAAAEHWFGEGHAYISAESFHDVFTALEDGRADQAVVAIENSMYGSITDVYDLLQDHDIPVVGEVVEHIHQNLIGFPGTNLSDIKKIYSHPVALVQCARFFENVLPRAEIIEYFDTAAAVGYIKHTSDPALAAVAGTAAANLHGMDLLRKNIQDEQQNFTRFMVLDPKGTGPVESNKASLILTTSHEVGDLYRALGVFAGLGCNLTKLQSRPVRGKVWKYQFYADVEITPEKLQQAQSALQAQDCGVRILGTYMASGRTYED